jgi:hypothetical protein
MRALTTMKKTAALVRDEEQEKSAHLEELAKILDIVPPDSRRINLLLLLGSNLRLECQESP